MVEHMLRNGHHEAAAQLAEETGTADLVRPGGAGRRQHNHPLLDSAGITATPFNSPSNPPPCPPPQVDMNVHRAAREIEADLGGRSCAKALAWCEQHRSKLKKLGVRPQPLPPNPLSHHPRRKDPAEPCALLSPPRGALGHRSYPCLPARVLLSEHHHRQ